MCRAIYECKTDKERPLLDWHNYVWKVFPAGAASGLDVGFSNWGLELITVSL
jgi:solute carrier family 35 protein C2